MSKSLIIAEKPSVANDLARALGGFKKADEHFENERYIISSALGHLVELCLPSELDVKRGKWSFANLPIIPDEFGLKAIEKTQGRFNLLKRLIQRKDVTELINACDAGREGELIFRYLVKLIGSKKPVRRLWLQSMTAESIRAAFEHLRSNEETIGRKISANTPLITSERKIELTDFGEGAAMPAMPMIAPSTPITITAPTIAPTLRRALTSRSSPILK